MIAISAAEGYELWADTWDSTPSPIVAGIDLSWLTSVSRPRFSSDAAWSEPYIERSSVMWRSTATAPIIAAKTEGVGLTS